MWWKNTVKGKTWISDYESFSGTLDSLSFSTTSPYPIPSSPAIFYLPVWLLKKERMSAYLLWDFSYYTYRKSSFRNSQEVVIYTVGSSSSIQKFSATIKMCKTICRNAETASISGTPGMKKHCSAFAAHLCYTSHFRKSVMHVCGIQPDMLIRFCVYINIFY